ncbi:ABC transporter permease [Candidatus Woesearchaeota archaeon]|nr:ABC transporter permease [Candidatus Woesearchaeota archaeon]
MSIPGRAIKKISQIPISFWGMFVKEWKVLITRKKYLYLSIALPLILGIIYIFTLSTSMRGISLGVCDFDNTQTTHNALNSMSDFDVQIITDNNCSDILRENVRSGKFLFGIIIPEGFSSRLEDLQQSRLEVLYDNTDAGTSSMVSWRIDSALSPFQQEIVKVFATEIKTQSQQVSEGTEIIVETTDSLLIPKSIRNKALEVQNQIDTLANLDPQFVATPINVAKVGVFESHSSLALGLAPLFVILNLFLVLMLSSTGVISDKKMKMFSRLRASNSSPWVYVISKIVFFFLISLAQFVIIFILFLIFKANITINFIPMIKAVLLISLINSLIGFLIGLLSDNEGVALLISLVITLPAMFLSGMFFPVKLLPKGLQIISNILPVQVEMISLKEAVLFNSSVANMFFLIPLGLFIATLYFLKRQN